MPGKRAMAVALVCLPWCALACGSSSTPPLRARRRTRQPWWLRPPSRSSAWSVLGGDDRVREFCASADHADGGAAGKLRRRGVAQRRRAVAGRDQRRGDGRCLRRPDFVRACRRPRALRGDSERGWAHHRDGTADGRHQPSRLGARVRARLAQASSLSRCASASRRGPKSYQCWACACVAWSVIVMSNIRRSRFERAIRRKTWNDHGRSP